MNQRRKALVMVPEPPVSFEDVSTASFRIRDGIQFTSCKLSPTLSKRMGYEIFLKKDYRQMTGRCAVLD